MNKLQQFNNYMEPYSDQLNKLIMVLTPVGMTFVMIALTLAISFVVLVGPFLVVMEIREDMKKKKEKDL